jgi:hypothetical protein
LKLAHEQFSGASWRLEERNGEALLVVTGQPLLKETGDTVADAVFHSFESLGKVKDRLSGYFNPPART